MPEHKQMDLIPREQPTEDPQLEAEREAARKRLAELLKDPEFRAIEGFPIGEDEAILELSDPPYYTACPNPFLPEIIEKWQLERGEIRNDLGLEDSEYQREPFAVDVSEGKNDPIYNAHSYHTKVPHKAIMRYILHYTDPGDIVFDGFCGTGMTGVASKLLGDKSRVEELGYKVDNEGRVFDGSEAISNLGERKAILNDLSTAASFIAYNYSIPVELYEFNGEFRRIIKEFDVEYGWMYKTTDEKGNTGKINYTVWSDVYSCPECGAEMCFWDVAVNPETRNVLSTWTCTNCGIKLSKSPSKKAGSLKADRILSSYYDASLRKMVALPKQVPVLINFSTGRGGRREKHPDEFDLRLLEKIDALDIPNSFPEYPMMFKGEEWGDTWRAGVHLGLSHTHHFYLKRALITQAVLWNKINRVESYRTRIALKYLWQSLCLGFTKLNRYGATHFSQVNRILSGTMYVSSLVSEVSPHYAYDGKFSRLTKVFSSLSNPKSTTIVSTSSATNLRIQDGIVDYIFVDPPFGGNLMYSELNFLWESWLSVFTNNRLEAIVNDDQRKGLLEYQSLMEKCFKEFFRILKPGRWITVEFHNSQNSIWNSIQEALQSSGFVVADVRVLDKKQGTFKQVTTSSAVKQDLIISAYRPNGNLEQRFRLSSGSKDGVWEFIRYHLGKLPSLNWVGTKMAVNAERQGFLLFDRMIAFYIQRGVMIPISAPEFYAGLEQRFTRRNGMYFLPDQVAEYDRALLGSDGVIQLQMFVTDEKSAIAWLRQELDPNTNGKPQTQAELNPKFKLVLHQAKHEKSPELIDILEQNFLQDEQGHWYVPDPNKAGDLEKVRQRALLREFKEYTGGGGRLRQFRTEAVRAGFLDALRKQKYDTIIKVADRLPENVLREDPDLLMYYDSAMLRKK